MAHTHMTATSLHAEDTAFRDFFHKPTAL